MKIRSGFVSNSSSSSFLIYGISIETQEMIDIIKTNLSHFEKHFNEKIQNVEEFVENYEQNCDDYDCGIYDGSLELLSNKDIRHYSECDGDYNYLGVSWDKVKDNQTGKQFKESIEADLEKLLGGKVKCKTHSTDN